MSVDTDTPSPPTFARLVKWYLGNVAGLVLIVLVPIWIKTALHGFHNYDLGIFAQALHSIRPDNLNPFLPALNIPLFNDHFDPILILFAPLAHLFEPAYAALMIEHVLILLCPLPLLFMVRKHPQHFYLACLGITYLLFNRGILSALSFPVHPTTWAAFFLVLLAALQGTRRVGFMLLAAVLLMACKEEFPFVVLMLGLSLLWQKDRKVGLALMGLAVFWLFLAFGLRPIFVGETHHYASRVLGPLLEHPFETIWERLRDLGKTKRLWQCLLPLTPILIWQIKSKERPNWPMILAALPLLAIRFLDGAWQFHYMAPVAALLLLILWRPGKVGLPRSYAIVAGVMLLLLSMSPITKAVRIYGRVAELQSERMHSLAGARAHMLEMGEGKALVEGNLSPLLARRAEVYQIGGVQAQQTYRYFFTEKPPAGNPWPADHAGIDSHIASWRARPGVKVFHDDEYVFFSEDPAWDALDSNPVQ